MMQLQEVRSFEGSTPIYPFIATEVTMAGAIPNSTFNAAGILKTKNGLVWASNSIDFQKIVVGQNATKINANYSNYRVAGSALVGLCLIGAAYLEGSFPNQEFVGARPDIAIHEPLEKSSDLLVSSVGNLIGEAQTYSGLKLDMIAPLLGVSRRSIQYWKDGKNISQKNESQLIDLVDTLKHISKGDPDQTRNLLLARVTGVPRIYDLLAEQRYEKAIARAKDTKKLKPILSDPTLKFNSRPIADQLAFSDDGPAKPMGKLNRSVSRRIVR
jgi:hypothetical protein